jgi:hypothetical protein
MSCSDAINLTQLDPPGTVQKIGSLPNDILFRLVHEGISIINVVFRRPEKIYRSDASKFGLGGYNLITGSDWRFELPVNCRLRTSLNSLEF